MAGWKIVGAFIHYEDRVIHSPFTTKIVPVTVVVQASAVVVVVVVVVVATIGTILSQMI
jgi:hypothetical protein